MPDKIEYRIDCLEDDMTGLRNDVKKIMENHLPHIEGELIRLSTIIKVVGGLIMSGITALIVLGLTP